MTASCAGASAGTLLVAVRAFPARIALVTILSATLAGCSGGVLDPHGPVGGANALILLNAVGIMCVIVVPTIAAVLWCAWWFRAGNTRAQFRPDFVYSGRIELLVWAIPLLVILFLGGRIRIRTNKTDPLRTITEK